MLRAVPQLKVLGINNNNESAALAWADQSASGHDGIIKIKLLELRRLIVDLPTAMTIQLLRGCQCYIPALRQLTLSSASDKINALVARLVAPQTANTMVRLESETGIVG